MMSPSVSDSDDLAEKPDLPVTKSSSELRSVLLSLLTILIYYCFSISLTFYNRYLFVTYQYPLSITIIHLIVKYVLSSLIRSTLNFYHFIKKRPAKSEYQQRITLNWFLYTTRIIPTAIASAADIGLSNWSLQFITITLYTMSKSTVILFILFFSILFQLEKWRKSIILVILSISCGLFLFTFHSTEFHLFGFVLVMIASFMAGLRWTLAQAITQKHELGLANPIDMIYHVQPCMILCLLPLAVYIDGIAIISTDKMFRSDQYEETFGNIMWILYGAGLAFLLESSELLVVTFTSSLTLSISGIFKEICIIYIAVTWNNNKLNTMNTLGLIMCLLGITIHCYMKAKKEAQIISRDKKNEVMVGCKTRGANYSKLIDESDSESFISKLTAEDGESFELSSRQMRSLPKE
ncbi:solute carrier family 35 member C2 [Brachionus plicatilis]|uniref:Solute carrier family 35 member C2 n=1 Tax=Brachionus plicatilis TaxID=10195 RepID=A0A3M7Q9H7_BRAPC|nr:solute carrier family 35 member C2 [Brachionus plicatilis]